MADSINTNINVNLGNAPQTIGQLKAEYRDLLKSIENTAQGTAEYYAQLKRLAAIKGDLQDLKEGIRGLDPENKFKAIQGIAQGVVGGFTAATGAVAAFAGENKQLEQTLIKVNGAVALLGGFQAFTDGIKAAGVALGLTNPMILALQVALGILAVGMALYAANTRDAIKETEDFIKVQQDLTNAINRDIDLETKQLISRAKARGASEQEITNIQLEQQEKRVKNAQAEEARLAGERDKAAEEFVKNDSKANAQAVDNLNARIGEARNAIKAEQVNLEVIRNDARANELKATKEQNQKIIDANREKLKKLREEEEKETKERLERIRFFNIENLRLQAEQELKLEQELAAKRQQQISTATGSGKIDPTKFRNPITGLTPAESQQAIIDDFANQELILAEQRANGLIGEEVFQQQILELKLKSLEAQRQALVANGQSTLEVDKQITEARIQLADKEAQAKIANLQLVSNALSNFSDLAGKETVAGKALAVAQTTIDTYLAAQKAYTSQIIPGDPSSVVRAVIAAASAVASGLVRVKSILAVKVPGKSGSGGATSGAGGIPQGAPSLAAASPVQTVNSVLNSGQLQEIGGVINNQRVYVLESDITNAQNRVRVQEETNTI